MDSWVTNRISLLCSVKQVWTGVYVRELLCLGSESLQGFLQTDFIGWIFNAVKHDRINVILVDFLNRICLNIPLCVKALFSPLHS